MKVFIGVDPGANGGIAELFPDKANAFSISGCGMLYISGYFEDINDEHEGEVFALIESVHSMPGQGVVSSFNFGHNFGMLEGFLMAAGIPYDRVTPQKWQKGYGLYKMPGESHTDKKNRHKALAQELFPTLKVTHATADALLIAEYCRRTYGDAESR